ncbi:ExbD/TolR family protein [Aeromonas hydrophila]|uniref:ExbD/TolR family protein n=1 Tax=Aeromonas hydrophila TaxID=644 RepID=UPI000332ADDC|nr:biopolymer transporter ExbD [Aeromonas hydrophila]AGM44376.1 biopolymer transport exbD1 protein [Aeromonas hydrophila ML09-119]AHX33046.1 biopolymer transporter ExbD [Aeromonas hydrophila subsp. hydrophila AL09-71]AHX69845.1 biopolymer transporter ExbD [Aeromonas hydrophila pc104A]AJE36127.1 biopolymer transporter ExbD [Aeromonas hydrophila J-1]AKJ34383.1 biopolymer transporter ExbD [Aeromonas hydrophila NJ-35]
MAFGKLSDEGDDQPLSEINMIPMIDVMLVLLIVFMITAPLLTNAVKLELPEASSQLNQPDKQDINLAIDGAGKIYWNDQEVDEAALLAKMESAGKAEGEQPEIQLRIDRKVEYGIIARVMAQASQHGLHKIAFVSQPEP